MLRADSKLADGLFDKVDLDKVLGTVLDSVDEERQDFRQQEGQTSSEDRSYDVAAIHLGGGGYPRPSR